MLEELHTASSLLRAALERYVNACSSLHNACLYKSSISSATEILSSVSNELGLVENYKGELTHVQVVVKRVRNALADVPINSLPPEVLTHIFHIVLSQQPCPFQASGPSSLNNPARMLKYPDTFTHVCSRWRQIALTSPGLWSHLDISPACLFDRRLHNRAEAYITRACQTPLDIHFIDTGICRQTESPPTDRDDSNSEEEISEFEDGSDNWSDRDSDDAVYNKNPRKFQLLSFSTKPHIRSLGLLAHHEYNHINSRALACFLAICSTQGLSELVIDVPSRTLSTPAFIETCSNSDNRAITTFPRLSLSEQQLERAWHSVKFLNLKGIYPRWTSAAYQGLTDLRLLGKRNITTSELTGILMLSPRLRILRCDFWVGESSQPDAPISPVTLDHLEVLDLGEMSDTSLAHFLPWLNPGPTPLRLSLRCNPTSTRLKDFFERSNVQELRIASSKRTIFDPLLPPDMFCLPSQLRVLALIGWDWNVIFAHRGIVSRSGGKPHPVQLETLYMIDCCYDNFSQFRATVEHYSPQKLILHDCYGVYAEMKYSIDALEDIYQSKTSEICPSVQHLTRKNPIPLQDWN
ncbi:hypothetical protein B0J17DRAFT_640959 [Rhizoctonia solani]|nr:hypothetical protein B0J17DRAFT_640959 [Rhizoctonia solani]